MMRNGSRNWGKGIVGTTLSTTRSLTDITGRGRCELPSAHDLRSASDKDGEGQSGQYEEYGAIICNVCNTTIGGFHVSGG